MPYKFSAESEKRFNQLVPMFPDMRSLILPALYLLQRDQGFVDTSGMEYLAQRIGAPVALSDIYGVATFYTMYNKKPVGKFHIQVCANIACYLVGSDKITSHLCKTLGIEKGQTTKDKKFTVDEVQCLGACGYGPMMQINENYHEFLNTEKVDSILGSLEK